MSRARFDIVSRRVTALPKPRWVGLVEGRSDTVIVPAVAIYTDRTRYSITNTIEVESGYLIECDGIDDLYCTLMRCDEVNGDTLLLPRWYDDTEPHTIDQDHEIALLFNGAIDNRRRLAKQKAEFAARKARTREGVAS